jgi:hypothetical protein
MDSPPMAIGWAASWYLRWMGGSRWMIVLVLVACGPTASPGPGDSGGADGTSGAGTDPGASASASASGPGTTAPGGTTAGPADTSGDPVTDDGSDFPTDECDPSLPDCQPGYVCCGNITDPYVCTAVPPGQCGGDVECAPGSECVVNGLHCGIGECVPVTESSSSDGTGDPSTSGSTSASTSG